MVSCSRFLSRSAFIVAMTSLVVSGSFICSNGLHRKTNVSSPNRVKSACLPCGFGYRFWSLLPSVVIGTECNIAEDSTDLPDWTAAMAWRMFSNMVMNDYEQWTKGPNSEHAQADFKTERKIKGKHCRDLIDWLQRKRIGKRACVRHCYWSIFPSLVVRTVLNLLEFATWITFS